MVCLVHVGGLLPSFSHHVRLLGEIAGVVATMSISPSPSKSQAVATLALRDKSTSFSIHPKAVSSKLR